MCCNFGQQFLSRFEYTVRHLGQPQYQPMHGHHQQTPGSSLLSHAGPVQLWQFLLELLSERSFQNIIAWTGNGWEFKLKDPDEVG